jgi:endogenous inhibitor of DNA gyrase (YacG/DUF329 family)
MKCPICKKEVKLGDADFPFCSERCRILDLANWATEKYVIPAPIQPGDLDEADESNESGHRKN